MKFALLCGIVVMHTLFANAKGETKDIQKPAKCDDKLTDEARSPRLARLACIDDTKKDHLQSNESRIVFVDGIFDVPHFGHEEYILAALQKAATVLKVPEHQVQVLVGISGTPDEIEQYKRKSVYSFAEKKAELCGFKGVGWVVNSEMVTTEAFLDRYGIDVVVAGGDYADLEKAKKYYAAPIARKIFHTVDRVVPVSTSDIMRRTVEGVAGVLKKKLNREDPADADDLKDIDSFLELMHRKF